MWRTVLLDNKVPALNLVEKVIVFEDFFGSRQNQPIHTRSFDVLQINELISEWLKSPSNCGPETWKPFRLQAALA